MRLLRACLCIAVLSVHAFGPGASATPTLDAGWGHNLAATASRQAWAWGDNDLGKLGNGTTTSSSLPVRSGELEGVVAVAAGANVSVALLADGTVWTWGHGSALGLAAAPTTCAAPSYISPDPWFEPCAKTPVRVPGIAGARAIAAGGGHVLVLMGDGTLRAWGENAMGQLGNGAIADSATPVTVSGLTAVAEIAAGADFSLARRNDGTVWAWGNSVHGELGIGETAPSTCLGRDPYGAFDEAPLPCARVPVRLGGLPTASAIAARGRHGLALRADGTVWAWGANRYGQLGDGLQADRKSPVAVPGLSGVTKIAAGFGHSVAMRGDGAVWTWGLDSGGQLGRTSAQTCAKPGGGSATPCGRSPGRASAHEGAAAIVAGGAHTIVVRGDGTLDAFGWNVSGQLGRDTPMAPTTLSAIDPHSPLFLGGAGTGTSIGKPSTSGGLNLSTIDDGLSFVAQAVGTTSAAQEVEFRNLTESALAIRTIAVYGNFTGTNDCGASLAAFAACRLQLRFAPKLAGERRGTVTVATDSPYAPSVTLQLSGTGTSPTIPANYSDIWWNPAESGWGLTISDHETQLFAVWYTYEASGKPTWFVVPGGTFTANRRIFTGDVYSTTGPCYSAPSFDAALVRVTRVGTATVDFAPPDLPSGWARYSGTIGTTAWSKAITRQPFGNASPSWGSDFTDIWWNAAESGWGLALSQHGNNVFGVLFTYDCDGSPLFVALPSVSFQDAGRFAGDVYTTRSAGSWWGSATFEPAHVTATRAGNASLAFAGVAGNFTATIGASTRTRAIVPQPFGHRAPGGP